MSLHIIASRVALPVFRKLERFCRDSLNIIVIAHRPRVSLKGAMRSSLQIRSDTQLPARRAEKQMTKRVLKAADVSLCRSVLVCICSIKNNANVLSTTNIFFRGMKKTVK